MMRSATAFQVGVLPSCNTSGVDGQRIQQMGRPLCGCPGEAMIPIVEHRPQRIASCRQVPNLLVEAIEDMRGGGADIMARGAAGLTRPEKGRKLVERESHTHRVADQQDTLDNGWRKETVPSGAA